MTDVTTVRADLLAEQGALDAVMEDLPADDWKRSTPSAGWTVADQIGHLAYFDRAAATAITDPERFAVLRDALLNRFFDGIEEADDLTLESARSMGHADLLDHWRSGRRMLADASATLADDDRIEWYGPSMGSKSFLTARLMECWAHGQDIVDTVGAARPATDRLRHVAQLGVITRGWSYVNRGEDPPDVEVRVRLDSPTGQEWAWGPDDAGARVDGDAEQFCLVVTQRRNVDDTDLEVVGDAAREWLDRAQAFAGPATDGPEAGRVEGG
ncbi:MAG: TIGR03084 family metal-binding protein [Actinomycetota bacterium]